MEPYIVVAGVLKFPCDTLQQAERHIKKCAEMGMKEVQLYRAERIDLAEFVKNGGKL
jgi:hypothetical protein